MNNKEKIELATLIYTTTKDYIELLKVSQKLTRDFNAEVIENQIEFNEQEIFEYVNKLQGK